MNVTDIFKYHSVPKHLRNEHPARHDAGHDKHVGQHRRHDDRTEYYLQQLRCGLSVKVNNISSRGKISRVTNITESFVYLFVPTHLRNEYPACHDAVHEEHEGERSGHDKRQKLHDQTAVTCLHLGVPDRERKDYIGAEVDKREPNLVERYI